MSYTCTLCALVNGVTESKQNKMNVWRRRSKEPESNKQRLRILSLSLQESSVRAPHCGLVSSIQDRLLAWPSKKSQK